MQYEVEFKDEDIEVLQTLTELNLDELVNYGLTLVKWATFERSKGLVVASFRTTRNGNLELVVPPDKTEQFMLPRRHEREKAA